MWQMRERFTRLGLTTMGVWVWRRKTTQFSPLSLSHFSPPTQWRRFPVGRTMLQPWPRMEKFTPGDVVNLVRSNGIQLLVTVTKKICWKKERYMVLSFFSSKFYFVWEWSEVTCSKRLLDEILPISQYQKSL